MKVRIAKAEDLPRIVHVYAQAFLDEELTAWLFPRRREYFDDYTRAFGREINAKFYAPGHAVLVAETEVGDTQTEGSEVVAFAIWERHGTSETALGWHKDSFWNKLERWRQIVVATYQDYLAPDRAADQSRGIQLEEVDAFEDIRERLHLTHIATLPSFQRQGIAAQLMRWGLEQAQQEKIPVTLEATIGAEPLYRHLGFRDYSYICLSDGIDGPALIWVPEGQEDSFGSKLPPRESLIGRAKGRKWKPVDLYPVD